MQSKPYPEDMIKEVLDIARLAPSNSNTALHVAIAPGAARDRLQKAILDYIDMGARRIPNGRPAVWV